VHRDFKPENVLVGRDGRVRVLDFGLARTEADFDPALDGPPPEIEDDPLEGDRHTLGTDTTRAGLDSPTLHVVDLPGRNTQLSTRLTQVGAIMGTPAYMAPEQHQGHRTDARSDQFSFCVALYESLYGQRPYPGRTRAELLVRMLEGEIREAPRDAAVPGWVRRVLIRGLATKPEERWEDMDTLLAALSPKPKTSRRGVVVAGVGLSVVTAAVIFAWPDSAPAEAPCQGADRKLVGVWDDEIRTTVEQAFDATQRPYAADAFATTARFLDDYTDRWVEMHTEACLATSVRKEQSQDLLDRQMICLGRRLKNVGALTRLLAEADAQMVTEAVSATTSLPQLSPCGDPELVAGGVAPLSGAKAEQAATVDDHMAQARSLDALGRYEAALTSANAARDAARTLAEPGRRAETTALLGQIQLHAGDAKLAESTLLEAVWLADAAQADLVRARSWTDLVWAVGYEQARADEVDPLRRHAEASLDRGGGNPLLSASLHENLGGIARNRKGEPEAAMREHEEALEIRREQLGPDAPQVARSLVNLSQSRADLGQFEAAERDLEEAMQIFVAKYGKTHPLVASVLHGRGILAFRRDAHERAASLLRQAILVDEAALPPDHPQLASAVHDLGEVLLNGVEDHTAALPQYRRAAKLRRALLGDEPHPSVANSLTGAGRALAGLGRADEAIEVLEEAMAIHDAMGKKGRLDRRAETEAALARVLEDSDPERARKLALSARAALSAAGQPDAARELDDLIEPPSKKKK